MEYKKHLSEPWFSLVKLNIKTIEGRLIKGDFSKMKINDIIINAIIRRLLWLI